MGIDFHDHHGYFDLGIIYGHVQSLKFSELSSTLPPSQYSMTLPSSLPRFPHPRCTHSVNAGGSPPP